MKINLVKKPLIKNITNTYFKVINIEIINVYVKKINYSCIFT